MTKARDKRAQASAEREARSAKRRGARSMLRAPRSALRVLVCGAIVAAMGLGWSLWSWYSAAAPPPVSFVEVDPALAGAIQAASRDVWWHPHSAAAWARLGQLLRAHLYTSESNLCFAQAGRLDPTDSRWPYLQGLSLQSDDPEAAVRHLQRAVALCGSVPDAPELCLAEVCLQQGRQADAEQHFRHVLQNDPDNARAHLGLGRLDQQRSRLADGLAHLNR